MKHLKAEWEEHKAILMAFPHQNSDWVERLEDARECFCEIIKNILNFESVLLCVDTRDKEGWEVLHSRFHKEILNKHLILASIPTNDTWARDFGGISIEESQQVKILDFGFNGWGLKYPANFDNQITQNLASLAKENPQIATIISPDNILKVDMVLEGGSIDTNGAGVLLTNTQCLLESNRNPHLTQEQIQNKLKDLFGVKEVLWLHYGYLAGDDTDSHIDTLARFIASDKIAYMKCEDSHDEHFEALKQMEEELQSLRQSNGKPYELIALPLPQAIYDQNHERLPASYVNFLFVNGGLLVPTYNDANDSKVLEILRAALPNHQVIGIDCHTLILWHGSLHCVTMQMY